MMAPDAPAESWCRWRARARIVPTSIAGDARRDVGREEQPAADGALGEHANLREDPHVHEDVEHVDVNERRRDPAPARLADGRARVVEASGCRSRVASGKMARRGDHEPEDEQVRDDERAGHGGLGQSAKQVHGRGIFHRERSVIQFDESEIPGRLEASRALDTSSKRVQGQSHAATATRPTRAFHRIASASKIALLGAGLAGRGLLLPRRAWPGAGRPGRGGQRGRHAQDGGPERGEGAVARLLGGRQGARALGRAHRGRGGRAARRGLPRRAPRAPDDVPPDVPPLLRVRPRRGARPRPARSTAWARASSSTAAATSSRTGTSCRARPRSP